MKSDIQEDFVKHTTAQLLKAKGFDVPVSARYFKGKFVKNTLGHNLYNHNGGEISNNYISAPTQALVLKWLRRKYNLHIVTPLIKEGGFQSAVGFIKNGEVENLFSSGFEFGKIKYDSQEEAIEDAILFCLKEKL